MFWAAFQWTADEKYLAPLLSGAPRTMVSLAPDVMTALGKREAWGPDMVAAANAPDTYRLSNTGGAGSPLAMARFGAWQTTGDKTYLEQLYGAEIRSANQRMSMMTEGELWTDRVQIPSEMLQRSRLGGVASRRNQIQPGHVVSWRFGGSDSAGSVAILLPAATETAFKVIVFNVEDHPVQATLTGANIRPGQWRVVQGLDADNNDQADTPSTSTLIFGPGIDVPLVLPPKQAMVLNFDLAAPGAPLSARPDVGLDPEDVVITRGAARVTVHSLGGVDAPAGEVLIETASGQVVARAPFPPLAAPLDLTPKTTTASLRLPRGLDASDLRVRLALSGSPEEVSAANNVVMAP